MYCRQAEQKKNFSKNSLHKFQRITSLPWFDRSDDVQVPWRHHRAHDVQSSGRRHLRHGVAVDGQRHGQSGDGGQAHRDLGNLVGTARLHGLLLAQFDQQLEGERRGVKEIS